MLSVRHTLSTVVNYSSIVKSQSVASTKINKIPTNIHNIKFLRVFSSCEKSKKNINSNKCSKEFLKPKAKSNESKRIFFNFVEEYKKFRQEMKENYIFNHESLKIKDPRDKINMLFTFENESSLSNFVVSTDSSSAGGYSSASLKLTQDETALFSGYLSTEIPKTGNVARSGFANMMCNRKKLPFYREGNYDLSYYTHLVLKIRGDGRTYLLVLPTIGEYDISRYFKYCYPMWTRGGPYWQLVRIPFRHFVFGNKASILDDQQYGIPLDKISKVGITLGDNCDGPFKLEIEYIGLEMDKTARDISPYEQYYSGNRFT